MMDKSDAAFFKRLLETFRGEAQERLQALSTAIVELEKTARGERQQALIETVFREVHSLKGAARAVDKREIEQLCQVLESVLSALKRMTLDFSPAIADLLLAALDLLNRLLDSLETISADALNEIAVLCKRLEHASNGTSAARVPPQEIVQRAEPPPPMPPTPMADNKRGADTVRVSTSKLDSLLLQAEGLLTVKLTAAQRVIDIDEIGATVATLKKERLKIAADIKILQRAQSRVSVDSDRKDRSQLRKLLEVFRRENAVLSSLDAKLHALSRTTERDSLAVNGMVDNLLDDIKKASMLPVNSVLNIFPKLVRDLARASGKEIELVLEGGDIEIDRRILEEIRDPLIHLVRNAIDHGIEKAEQRRQAGKPAHGVITLAVTQQEGDRIQVLVGDDGSGINRELVRDAVRRMGLNANEELTALDDERLVAFVFESGLSTSRAITDISGRGLGLAIVRDKVELLGGSVSIDTQAQTGTRFLLSLPLTLATYRGVHVLSGGRQFVFPLTHVDQVTTFNRTAVRTVQNRETVTWKDRAVALVRLSDLLKLPTKAVADENTLSVVIGCAAEKRIAFLVDTVVGEQEVLVKTLGPQLPRVRNITGATVLGNGSIALILNVVDLARSASNSSTLPRALRDMPLAEQQKKSILVAEDSITSRMLLRGVLEAAGYRVVVAVDGEDAFTKLQADTFDLLVSDVDMPRMSGFDLTARVRGDQQLKMLPVVLVTALASVADRERGIDVGASAYIVKSNFEEGHLLDVVRRLL
ncbi:MAG: cheAY40H-2 [Verrucomicrobiaceae bacterium]|nr:cheAY40H-2 [Verrucomicrobiaceae bacterium]